MSMCARLGVCECVNECVCVVIKFNFVSICNNATIMRQFCVGCTCVRVFTCVCTCVRM